MFYELTEEIIERMNVFIPAHYPISQLVAVVPIISHANLSALLRSLSMPLYPHLIRAI